MWHIFKNEMGSHQNWRAIKMTKNKWGAIKAVFKNTVGAVHITGDVCSPIFICSSLNNFFSELHKHHKRHTQAPLVPFLRLSFLLSSLGVYFPLHSFRYSNYDNLT